MGARVDGDTRIAVAGPDAVCLQTPVELRGENLRTVGGVHGLGEGERVPFVLTWFPSHHDPPDAIDAESRARGHLLATGDEWLGALQLRRPLARGRRSAR